MGDSAHRLIRALDPDLDSVGLTTSGDRSGLTA